MEKKFKRNIHVLEDVFNFIEQSCSMLRVDGHFLFSINFVVEELFTNMVKYNRSLSLKDIAISIDRRDEQLYIQLTDFDVDPFDITAVTGVNISQPLEERKPGGLGIHLIKTMVDDIRYEYANRESTITLIKNLG